MTYLLMFLRFSCHIHIQSDFSRGIPRDPDDRILGPRQHCLNQALWGSRSPVLAEELGVTLHLSKAPSGRITTSYRYAVRGQTACEHASMPACLSYELVRSPQSAAVLPGSLFSPTIPLPRRHSLRYLRKTHAYNSPLYPQETSPTCSSLRSINSGGTRLPAQKGH